MGLPEDPTPHRTGFAPIASEISVTHYRMALRAYDIMSAYVNKPSGNRSPTDVIQTMAESFRNIEHQK